MKTEDRRGARWRSERVTFVGAALAALIAWPAAAAEPAVVDVAIIAGADGIQRVPLDGSAPTMLAKLPASWCAVDARAQVVWLLTHEGENAPGVLQVLDLTQPGARPTPVVTGIPQQTSVAIDHGQPWGVVGREWETFGPKNVLTLSLQRQPRLKATVECEGDGAWDCFNPDDFSKPEKQWRLNPQKQAEKRELQRARIVAAALLRTLAARGDPHAVASAKSVAPKLPLVPVADDNCEGDGCGEAEPIAGTPYWSVEVANSRGDFFHATHALYDPRSQRFLDPFDPKVQSPVPLDEAHAIRTLLVAPHGQGALMGDAVLAWQRGAVVKDAKALCGWIGGGMLHALPFD